jgi:hypothetical protein
LHIGYARRGSQNPRHAFSRGHQRRRHLSRGR